MSVGMRPGGLNPICAAEIWKSVGLPRMWIRLSFVTESIADSYDWFWKKGYLQPEPRSMCDHQIYKLFPDIN